MAKLIAKIDWEKCVDLANKRLRDVVAAANKADTEEMKALMLSSISTMICIYTVQIGLKTTRLKLINNKIY